MDRDAAAYASLLAGFGAFKLRRYVHVPGKIHEQAVYHSSEPTEAGERSWVTAMPESLLEDPGPDAAVHWNDDAYTADP